MYIVQRAAFTGPDWSRLVPLQVELFSPLGLMPRSKRALQGLGPLEAAVAAAPRSVEAAVRDLGVKLFEKYISIVVRAGSSPGGGGRGAAVGRVRGARLMSNGYYTTLLLYYSTTLLLYDYQGHGARRRSNG